MNTADEWVAHDYADLAVTPQGKQIVRVRVDKGTHAIEMEEENEDAVTVVIRPRQVRSDDYDANR